MGEEGDVFGVVERGRDGGSLVGFLLVAGFAGEDACNTYESPHLLGVAYRAPFKIQSLLKSARDTWSFLTADERVMYAFAAPALPFLCIRPMSAMSAGEVMNENNAGHRRHMPEKYTKQTIEHSRALFFAMRSVSLLYASGYC